MDSLIDAAVAVLREKLSDTFDGSARFVVEDEGAIIIDSDGVRAGDDEETDVVLSADADTFRAILDGELNPTAAFMSGRLSVDGDMGTVLKLGNLLA